MISVELVPFEVLGAFSAEPSLCTVRSLGKGNINDTFLVSSLSESFVLQRINGEVFPEPYRVVENFRRISSYLSAQQRDKDNHLRVAFPVLTLDNKYFVRDAQGDLWRGQSFLSHTSIRVLTNSQQAYQVGRTLALFHKRLSGLDGGELLDPLPGFHYLPSYLEDYDREVERRASAGSEDGVTTYCARVIERFRKQGSILEDAKDAGILQLQPIHGDPKVDNFIFDEEGQAQGLLDLDTVAMGLVHHDLGDCLRSCCNILGEEGDGGQSISFNMDFCQGLLEGYWAGSDNLLSARECDYIFDGLLLICFELGLRFFTDHFQGNRYFKVEKERDNLLRAARQFRLTENIAAKEKQIRGTVKAVQS